MKAKRQNPTLSVSATMLDGSGGQAKPTGKKECLSKECWVYRFLIWASTGFTASNGLRTSKGDA
jgi:hypothetical protein